jgi:hypothetical protein
MTKTQQTTRDRKHLLRLVSDRSDAYITIEHGLSSEMLETFWRDYLAAQPRTFEGTQS